MSANVESMFYVREKPWHGLGTKVKEAPTSADALIYADLDRHTAATLLIAAGVDVRTISARLGHALTSTTLNIYIHALKESDRKAADAVSALLEKQP